MRYVVSRTHWADLAQSSKEQYELRVEHLLTMSTIIVPNHLCAKQQRKSHAVTPQ